MRGARRVSPNGCKGKGILIRINMPLNSLRLGVRGGECWCSPYAVHRWINITRTVLTLDHYSTYVRYYTVGLDTVSVLL